MAVGDSTYEDVMEDLRHRLPDVAAQLEDEVLRGRPISVSQLSLSDRADRQENLREAEAQGMGKLQGIGVKDVAVVPYSEEERLDLVCRALVRLAETMHGSRLQLLKLAEHHQVESSTLIFTLPESQEGQHLLLPDEVSATEDALTKVRRLLLPWLEREGTTL
jgi:hypothetical protein